MSVRRALANLWTHPDRRLPTREPTTPVAEGLFDEEDRGWRSLSSYARELPPHTRAESLANADEAWTLNPLARALIELTLDMVLGSGLSLEAETDLIQRAIAEWWGVNELDLRQFDWLSELSISGNLFLTQHVRGDRLTLVRVMPTNLMDEIETDPNDYTVELRYRQAAPVERWWSADQMDHWSINRLAGQSWGLGDLHANLPWLRRYRDWLTDRVRANAFKNAYLWDVTLTGADQRTIAARRMELGHQPPASGSVLVHNESEAWQAVTPQIHADEAALDGKAIRRMIATGARLPLHWLAEADDANRAVAREQALPTNRHFERRQLIFGTIVVHAATNALKRQGYTSSEIGQIAPRFPSTDPVDSATLASAAKNLAAALDTGVQGGWLSPDDAARHFQAVLGHATAQPDPMRGSAHGAVRPPAARGVGLRAVV